MSMASSNKSKPTVRAGKVKVKIKQTPAVHIHTSKQVVLKTGIKPKSKEK
jgi:hypothetical protein